MQHSTKRSQPDNPIHQNGSPKRPKTESVTFRLLCHSSRIGGVIGKSGSIIKSLQTQTSSKIRIQPAPPDSPDRVISITSSPCLKPTKINNLLGEKVEEVGLCAAQEGLVKVFERVLHVAAETDGVGIYNGLVSCRLLAEVSEAGSVIGKGGKVVEGIRKDTGCKIRVLKVDKSCQGVAGATDELIEIEGDVLAVKKALVAVSRCIQECPPDKTKMPGNRSMEAVCSQTLPESCADLQLPHHSSFLVPIRSLEAFRSETLPELRADLHLPHHSSFLPSIRSLEAVRSQRLPELHADPHLPQRSTLLPPISSSSISYSSGVLSHFLSIEPERIPSYTPPSYSTNPSKNVTVDMKTPEAEVTFRILCANEKVGGVIGKGGTIIEALKRDTGASITIGALTAVCDERLITISATENMESRYSPAQNAVLLVFSRSVEAGVENSPNPSLKNGAMVMVRLLIQSNQVGCLLGKGGTIVSLIRKATGAGIHILGSDEVPMCAAENDQVVQISGEFVKVQDALYHVTGRLRDNLFPRKTLHDAATRSGSSIINEISPYNIVRDQSPIGFHPSYDVSHSYSRPTTITKNMDHLGPSHNLGRPNSPRSWESQTLAGVNLRGLADVGGGLTSIRGGLELGSGSRSAIVTSTTVEITVPENVVGSVYGVNGSNLARLRQISGAKVILHEPLGTRDRIIVISGTPDETQAAQSLLQAFILTGSS